MDGRARAKLAAELDQEGRWFKKAARRYRTRQWVSDMRRALGIGLAFLAEETQVCRSTLRRAEERETTGAIQIAELEALAAAMECELVYAIVPKRGTVAELAEDWKAHPRKGRKQREKEAAEYKAWYDAEVDKMQQPSRDRQALKDLLKRMEEGKGQGPGTRDQGPEDQGSGTEKAGTEGPRDQGTEKTGTEGQGTFVRGPGAQRIRDAVAGAMKEMGPEKEEAIRAKAARYAWDQPTKGMSPATIEWLRLAKEQWEKEQATGNGEQQNRE